MRKIFKATRVALNQSGMPKNWWTLVNYIKWISKTVFPHQNNSTPLLLPHSLEIFHVLIDSVNLGRCVWLQQPVPYESWRRDPSSRDSYRLRITTILFFWQFCQMENSSYPLQIVLPNSKSIFLQTITPLLWLNPIIKPSYLNSALQNQSSLLQET